MEEEEEFFFLEGGHSSCHKLNIIDGFIDELNQQI